MNEISERLQRAVEHRSQAQDIPKTLGGIADRIHRRRRARRVVGACAVTLVLGLGGVALYAGLDEDTATHDLEVRTDLPSPTTNGAIPTTTLAPTTSTSSPSSETAVPTTGEDGRTAYPSPPLAVRGDAAVVWTGAQLVVWGGDVEAFNMGLPGPDKTFADGAVLDPATSEWQLLPEGPLPATSHDPVGLLTEHGVLFARDRSVALWDPAANTWTTLPDGPDEIHDLVGGGSFAISASANAMLDLAAQTWSPLPEPPLSLHRPSSVWTGNSLVVVGGPGTPFTDAAAISFDPAVREWSVLPEIPGLRAEAASVAWDGERLVAVNYDMSAVAFSPSTELWTQLPLVPARFSEWYPSALTTGETTIARMAQAVAVLRDDEWLPLPAETLTGGHDWSTVVPAAGSDATFFVWSLDQEAATNRVVAVDLDAAFATSRAIQVGVAGLTLGDELEVASASYQQESGKSVMVELVIDSETCTVTSTYGFGGQDNTWDPVTLLNDGVDTPWRVSPDETVINTLPTTSDRVEVACERPATTLEVARRATFAYHEQRAG